MSSPTRSSPAKSPQTKFSNEIDDSVDQIPYRDHPDAPLPAGESQGSASNQHHNQNEEYIHRCESSSETEVQPALAQSEPRPIDDDYDTATAAPRPRHAWQVLWLRNKGMALVLLAQMFGASMNVMTQILEIHSAMHPFQVRTWILRGSRGTLKFQLPV